MHEYKFKVCVFRLKGEIITWNNWKYHIKHVVKILDMKLVGTKQRIRKKSSEQRRWPE
jgi:hypothetical protein